VIYFLELKNNPNMKKRLLSFRAWRSGTALTGDLPTLDQKTIELARNMTTLKIQRGGTIPTATPGATESSALSFGPHITPIDVDRAGPTFALNSEERTRYLKDLIEQRMSSGEEDEHTMRALEFLHAKILEPVEISEAEKEFWIDFMYWLIGMPRSAEDRDKTPWLNAESVTPIDQRNLANHFPDVAKFVGVFTNTKQEFDTQLKELKIRLPTNLLQSYIYFKYIIRGSQQDFLSDFNLWKMLDEHKKALPQPSVIIPPPTAPPLQLGPEPVPSLFQFQMPVLSPTPGYPTTGLQGGAPGTQQKNLPRGVSSLQPPSRKHEDKPPPGGAALAVASEDVEMEIPPSSPPPKLPTPKAPSQSVAHKVSISPPAPSTIPIKALVAKVATAPAPAPTPTKIPVPTPTKIPVPTPTKIPVPTPTKIPVPTPAKTQALAQVSISTPAPIPTPSAPTITSNLEPASKEVFDLTSKVNQLEHQIATTPAKQVEVDRPELVQKLKDAESRVASLTQDLTQMKQQLEKKDVVMTPETVAPQVITKTVLTPVANPFLKDQSERNAQLLQELENLRLKIKQMEEQQKALTPVSSVSSTTTTQTLTAPTVTTPTLTTLTMTPTPAPAPAPAPTPTTALPPQIPQTVEALFAVSPTGVPGPWTGLLNDITAKEAQIKSDRDAAAREQIQKLQGEVERLNQELQMRPAPGPPKIEYIEKPVEKIVENPETAKQLAQVKSQMAALEQEKAKLDTERQRLEQNIQAGTSAEKTLKEQLQSAETRAEHADSQWKDLVKRVESDKSQGQKLIDEKKNAESEVARLKAQMDDAKKEVTKLGEAAVAAHKASMEMKEKEKQTALQQAREEADKKLQEANAAKEAAIKKAKEDAQTTIKQKEETFQKTISQKEEDVATAKQRLETLQNQIDLEKKAHGMSKDRKAQELKRLQRQLDQAKADADKQIRQLAEEKDRSVKEVKEQAQKAREEAKQEVTKFRDDTFKQQKEFVAKTEAEKQEAIKHKEAEVRKAKEEVEASTQALAKLEERSKSQLAQKDEQITQTKQQHDLALRQQASDFRAKEVKIEANLEHAQESVAQLTAEMEHVHQRYGEKIDQLLATKEEVDKRLDQVMKDLDLAKTSLANEKGQSETQRSQYETQVNQLRTEVESLRANNLSGQQKLEEMNLLLEGVKTENQSLKSLVDKMRGWFRGWLDSISGVSGPRVKAEVGKAIAQVEGQALELAGPVVEDMKRAGLADMSELQAEGHEGEELAKRVPEIRRKNVKIVEASEMGEQEEVQSETPVERKEPSKTPVEKKEPSKSPFFARPKIFGRKAGREDANARMMAQFASPGETSSSSTTTTPFGKLELPLSLTEDQRADRQRALNGGYTARRQLGPDAPRIFGETPTPEYRGPLTEQPRNDAPMTAQFETSPEAQALSSMAINPYGIIEQPLTEAQLQERDHPALVPRGEHYGGMPMKQPEVQRPPIVRGRITRIIDRDARKPDLQLFATAFKELFEKWESAPAQPQERGFIKEDLAWKAHEGQNLIVGYWADIYNSAAVPIHEDEGWSKWKLDTVSPSSWASLLPAFAKLTQEASARESEFVRQTVVALFQEADLHGYHIYKIEGKAGSGAGQIILLDPEHSVTELVNGGKNLVFIAHPSNQSLPAIAIKNYTQVATAATSHKDVFETADVAVFPASMSAQQMVTETVLSPPQFDAAEINWVQPGVKLVGEMYIKRTLADIVAALNQVPEQQRQQLWAKYPDSKLWPTLTMVGESPQTEMKRLTVDETRSIINYMAHMLEMEGSNRAKMEAQQKQLEKAMSLQYIDQRGLEYAPQPVAVGTI
jgi:DNA repair exonuclease SbcCD ATPase subunit